MGINSFSLETINIMEAYSHFINLNDVLSGTELAELKNRAAEVGTTLKELLFENIPALANENFDQEREVELESEIFKIGEVAR
tara:strand:- start:14952 stop:15200 length:249 start_codon:yes stop_codon:yes gene_type:complete